MEITKDDYIKNYVEAREKLCAENVNCTNCPMYDIPCEFNDVETAVEIIWALNEVLKKED